MCICFHVYIYMYVGVDVYKSTMIFFVVYQRPRVVMAPAFAATGGAVELTVGHDMMMPVTFVAVELEPWRLAVALFKNLD